MHSIEDIKAEEQRRITANEIEEILSKKYKVKRIVADKNLIDNLLKSKVNFVFNLSTGIKGESRQSQVPALLEMLGIPYVGSGVLAHALALNKAFAKKIFKFHNVPTPYFQEFYTGKEDLDPNLKFPAIVKPACEGSGFVIHKDNLVNTDKDLYKRVERLIKHYQPPAIVEEYIDGREYTVGIIGNGNDKTVLPIVEIDFDKVTAEFDKFNTFESKHGQGGQKQILCPAKLTEEQKDMLEKAAIMAFDALRCRDFARVDIRVKDNKPYVLEINSLPGLQRGYSDFPLMAEVAGMSYEDLILRLLGEAIKRYENSIDFDEPEIV
ncbi:MAG: ATP-grasp domain-containing protein [Tepidanaerobacteraceae bacterium]